MTQGRRSRAETFRAQRLSHPPPAPARRHPWQYWAYRAGMAVAARLPRALGYRLGALGGELYFWANPAHSRKAVENFAVVLADDPRAPRVRDTARRSFRNYGKYLFDFFRQPSLDPDRIEADTISEGWEFLDAAHAAGRGAIIVTLHFGNWDFAGAIVACRGYPIVAVADRFTPASVDQLVRGTRERLGLGVIPLHGSGGLRELQRALRRNTALALVADRPQQDGGVEVTLFGARAWLPAGPARLSLRSGAPILPAYVLRRPGDRTYFGRIEEPVAFTPSGEPTADVRALTQALASRLEGILREHPDQWYMFRRMWPEEGGERGVRNAE